MPAKAIHTQLGLGTAAIGRPQYINLKQENDSFLDRMALIENGLSILDMAYEMGIRYVDTAPGYGIAEQIILKWLDRRKVKSQELELATKWGYTYVANFDPQAQIHEVKEHSLAKLNEQWAFSGQLLPYLKTYQIHSATFETGVLTNRAVLERLAELKHLYQLSIGLTTTGENQLKVLRFAKEVKVAGQSLFDLFQVTYNLFDQSLANEIQLLQQMGKRVVIKEALANGRVFPHSHYAHYQKSYALLSALASKYEVGIDAIALRFCIDAVRPFVVLSGAATKAHLRDNVKTLDFSLEEEDLVRLFNQGVPPEAYWAERKQLNWQ